MFFRSDKEISLGMMKQKLLWEGIPFPLLAQIMLFHNIYWICLCFSIFFCFFFLSMNFKNVWEFLTKIDFCEFLAKTEN